ncbi:MAG: DedA family protein [Cycloclasticus sp.]|nr:DedA family protein [Cycloclasticus sp.]MBQ0789048.1 DedA family protein [Cycloclasticus sp.]
MMFSELVETYGTLGLFVSSFVSSTLAPGGSEAVLVYLIHENQKQSFYYVLVASCGNTLGALTTYYMAYFASSKFATKLNTKKNFTKAQAFIERYGSVALLLSWLPLIGDVLCLAAGWAKLNVIKSLGFILLGKFLRYFFISWVIS